MTRGKGYKIDDLIGPSSFPCKFKCGTMLTFNRELKIHQEQWSNIIHSKTRCNYIKAKKRCENKEDDPRVAREYTVLELKEMLDRLPEKTDLIERVYLMIKSRKTAKDAVTLKEIALALYPTRCYIDDNGNKQPTHEAIENTSSAISRLRKSKYRKTVVVFAVFMDEYGQNRYYNMQTEDDYKPVERKQKKLSEGILEGIEVTKETIAMGSEERLKVEQELDIDLFSSNTGKKRRRKGKSDSGDNDINDGDAK